MVSVKLLAALGAASVAAAQDFTQEEIDSGAALKSISKEAFDAAMARLPESGEGCTKENVRVRKEWRVSPFIPATPSQVRKKRVRRGRAMESRSADGSPGATCPTR